MTTCNGSPCTVRPVCQETLQLAVLLTLAVYRDALGLLPARPVQGQLALTFIEVGRRVGALATPGRQRPVLHRAGPGRRRTIRSGRYRATGHELRCLTGAFGRGRPRRGALG